MATMIPAVIPGAPESEQAVFDLLRDDPATEGWVIMHGVKSASPSLLRREIDFLALIPDAAILCLEVKGGGFEVKGGQWYALSSQEMIEPPGKEAEKAMYGLDDQLRDRFSVHYKGAELPMDCVVLFTDTAWPSHLRPLDYPTIGLPDLESKSHQTLGQRLSEIAKEIRDDSPDNLRLDSRTIKDIQDVLVNSSY